jgi:hypothetical protein
MKLLNKWDDYWVEIASYQSSGIYISTHDVLSEDLRNRMEPIIWPSPIDSKSIYSTMTEALGYSIF